ncbi:hypothetical protein [Thermococcus sp.]|uniref:hypothetical protein n=1 Tax=Thermococcus sp. TaxID=35749 RepID=UPI0026378690|nr:hypothetical protein [Thermococcus sp.]
MGLFGKGKKKKTHEEVAAELGVPVWWVSRFLGYSTPINGSIKDTLKKSLGRTSKTK